MRRGSEEDDLIVSEREYIPKLDERGKKDWRGCCTEEAKYSDISEYSVPGGTGQPGSHYFSNT